MVSPDGERALTPLAAAVSDGQGRCPKDCAARRAVGSGATAAAEEPHRHESAERVRTAVPLHGGVAHRSGPGDEVPGESSARKSGPPAGRSPASPAGTTGPPGITRTPPLSRCKWVGWLSGLRFGGSAVVGTEPPQSPPGAVENAENAVIRGSIRRFRSAALPAVGDGWFRARCSGAGGPCERDSPSD